ncbi:DNA/RNA polymerases superfamily protein [Cucumis melo var. makuwa]|uniref:RNA-directed DNA polymerase n=1 Tax=Cucumis melo var. makuwa TaxID=1194695 RepID=A0A5A7SPZ6_CUCMM|nr:DNA/RNA polymerases superfamily protein [Cucumis melo var. makuwa]TYK21988.1 DNA/RNA polymerases superfamily protein [Cucumis melo var. makuwa]
MTEILSLRLEDTVCTQVEIKFSVPDRLSEFAEAPISIAIDDASKIRTGCKVLPKEIGRPKRAEPSDPQKAYRIERLKKLGATVFEGSTNPADAKRDEFLGLKQGSLLVVEYKRKYTELSRYVDVIVASKSDNCRRVERGLCFEICTPITAIAKWTDFSQLVETALCVEQSITEEKLAVELSRGASTTSGFRGRCSRVVPAEGTSGARQNRVVGRPRQQGKVYAMTQQEGEDAPELNRMLEPLSEGLAIYTLVGDVLLVNELLRNCELLVEGISILVDLIPLELQKLDVILGIDFLFAHYASMDCHRKEVVFRKPDFAEVVFRGIRKVILRSLISVLKAEKLLRKGCTAFLIHVVVVQREKLKPKDVLVVKKFFDAFLNDLSCLPPDREIEFTIELLPRTTLISQTPYRMAPNELKELKLNKVTMRNKYPLPRIDDLFDQLRRAALFSKIDLRSGYHQLKVKESDILKTTQNEYLDQFLIVFIDDILVYSVDREAYEQNPRILQTLWKDNVIYCDASRQGLGCVLVQDGNAIAYASRQLKKHECKANVVADALSRKSRLLKSALCGIRAALLTELRGSKAVVTAKVKPVRQKPGGLLNPLPVREWKWEHITIDFLFGLPRTSNVHDGQEEIDLEPEARGYRVHTGYVPLLTLSVLRDNDAIVEIEFRVPNRLSESTEASTSIESFSKFTCGISYFQSTVHSRQISIEKSVVGHLHDVFQSKLAGSLGGGVTCEMKCR